MTTKKTTTRTKTTGASKRKTALVSPEKRAAHGEIQRGIANLGKSIAEIQRGLRTAERRIEIDARKRIGELRKEGRAQLGSLNAKRRDVAASLKQASVAAGSSWDEMKQSAEAILTDARSAAAAFVSRIRDAITR
jgi:hypothetical protein